MPTSPHRRVQRERRYSMLQLRGDVRGCNGHRRRRMVQITTYPGTMPVAFAREGEAARKSLFFEVQSDFWDAAGRHDSDLQK